MTEEQIEILLNQIVARIRKEFPHLETIGILEARLNYLELREKSLERSIMELGKKK
jgi:hypothetical protein